MNRPGIRPATSLSLLGLAAALAAACSHVPMAPKYSQDGLPEAIRVPAGHRVLFESVGAGQLTYECRARAAAPDQHEWVFVGPEATLKSRSGQPMGRYSGPPATWQAMDGSRVTGVQVATAPGTPGAIALQLVKANPGTGSGMMQGLSYIQRVGTVGGLPIPASCEASKAGQKSVLPYQADYIFWTPA